MRKEGTTDNKGGDRQKGGKGRHEGKFKGGRGGKTFKGGRRDRNKGKPFGERLPKDPEAKKEFLDKEMEQYWIKGGHKELGK